MKKLDYQSMKMITVSSIYSITVTAETEKKTWCPGNCWPVLVHVY